MNSSILTKQTLPLYTYGSVHIKLNFGVAVETHTVSAFCFEKRISTDVLCEANDNLFSNEEIVLLDSMFRVTIEWFH